MSIVSPDDFTYEVAGETEPEQVASDPKYTLYGFDPENEAVIFVESRDPGAVDQSPFYHQGQLENAVGLVSMPIEVFHLVGNQIARPPNGVIFIHSVGRCGSTLMSKGLSAIPSVHSLSEPSMLHQGIS